MGVLHQAAYHSSEEDAALREDCEVAAGLPDNFLEGVGQEQVAEAYAVLGSGSEPAGSSTVRGNGPQTIKPKGEGAGYSPAPSPDCYMT